MTDAEGEALSQYIRHIADELELRDWTISLAKHPAPEDDTGAHILVTYGRKQAMITLGPDWDSFPPEQQRHHITHELVHCHMEAIQWTINNTQVHLGMAAFEMLNGCIKDNIELATDALADALAKHLPLPNQPKAKHAPAPKPDEAQAKEAA